MPLIGWGLGVAFTSIVREVDHWIAFGLLVFIGSRMVYAGLSPEADAAEAGPASGSGWGLLSAAIATSIDAAAAGVTFPMLGLPVLLSCATIGLVTFVMSAAGLLVGGVAGALIGRRAEVLGGLVLIGIGTKILIEHLFFGG
jgi:putative Mn2+ efflux pump MntP